MAGAEVERAALVVFAPAAPVAEFSVELLELLGGNRLR